MNRIFFIKPLLLLLPIVCTVGVPPVIAMQESSKTSGQVGEPNNAPVTIHFNGFLPGNTDTTLSGKFEVDFRLYRSPQGGEPVWREHHLLDVSGGRVDVKLGSKQPIPMDIHEATFKWIGASVGGQREIFPRYHVVNVVYVSLKEALLAREREQTQDSKSVYDTLTPRIEVSGITEKACTWREALNHARQQGGDLSGFEDWYGSIVSPTTTSIEERTGHYEWVLPWAYDTASHGRYNEFFRGRFQGCDYMDLSPQKQYVYRMAQSAARQNNRQDSKTKEGTR